MRKVGAEPLDFCLAGLLSSAAFSLYLSYPTRCYVLEGLARAIPIELGLFQRVLLGNYLLYGVIGQLFYFLLQSFGFSGHAYIALQVMDGLLGAMGLFVFYFILKAIGTDRFFSCVWTSVLAVSLGYWMWSTEAENYIFSTLLLQINFLFLILDHKTRGVSPWLLGALQAVAIFGHLVNGLFGGVALWFFIATYPGQWRKAFMKYALSCAVILALGFGSALIVLRPADGGQAIQWILGSAGGPSGQWRWHGSGWTLHGIHDWGLMSFRIFGSFSDRVYFHPPAWPWSGSLLKAAAAFLGVFVLLGVVRFRTLWREQKAILGACGLWLALYAMVFTSWEPHTMVYRVSDLIPLVTVLALISQTLPLWFGERFVAAVMAVCLALGNFGAEILPRSFWGNNPSWSYMQFLKSSTEETAWICGTNGVDNIYISYFSERRPLVVYNYRDRPEQLRVLLNRIWSVGQKVYVTTPVLSDPFWKGFFGVYRLDRRAQDISGTTLYLVKK